LGSTPDSNTEGVGFEPTVTGTATTVFKTAPLNRSGTPPWFIAAAVWRFSRVSVATEIALREDDQCARVRSMRGSGTSHMTATNT
jgi:hypothetical protein